MEQVNRDRLAGATGQARARISDERDSWPDAERDDGPVHISVVIGEWLRMRSLSEWYAEWQARQQQAEVVLSQCGEAE